jgi:hypothetical protein
MKKLQLGLVSCLKIGTPKIQIGPKLIGWPQATVYPKRISLQIGGTSFQPLVPKCSALKRTAAQYCFEYLLLQAEVFRYQLQKYFQIMLLYPRHQLH